MQEQCRWAKEAGVDYMIAETFWDYGEASLALKVLKKYGENTLWLSDNNSNSYSHSIESIDPLSCMYHYYAACYGFIIHVR